MAHLVRIGLALALAATGFLTLRSLVLQGTLSEPRLALVAPRQQTSETRWGSKPLQFSDPNTCAGAKCHQDSFDTWKPSAHGSVNCETCHGAAAEHRQNPQMAVPMDLGPELCRLCHEKLPGRPAKFPQIEVSQHYPETTCTSCHMAHQPGPPPPIPHDFAQGSDCVSCHAPTSPSDRRVPTDHARRTNDQCLTCHERKSQQS